MDDLTLSLAVGLIVSLIFTEVFGLASGGMIVPGYFALYLNRPGDVALTVVCALLTFITVRGLAKYMIVYGRRRIALMILIGFLVGTALRGCAGGTQLWLGGPEERWCVIGFIIPGLIALWFDRQGVLATLGSLTTSAVVVRLVLILIGMEMVA
jgi:poly-gamma-glutamate biosynthesis protein PgsC/CapC